MAAMDDECTCCGNFNPKASGWSTAWTSTALFQNHMLKSPDILEAVGRGCFYCSLLILVMDEYVPDWKQKQDAVSVDVLAPHGRPVHIRIQQAIAPWEELVELAMVVVWPSEGETVF